MIWPLALIGLVFTSTALTLGTFWFVYGIWPTSWWMFWLFAFLANGQQEVAKYVIKKWMEELG